MSGLLPFDKEPIKLNGFELRARGAVAIGRPSIEKWVAAMSFANAAHESAQYWVGDLMAYADDRQDWKDKLDQAIAQTGLSRRTIINMTSVARAVAEPERVVAPTPSHAAVVQKFSKRDQYELLKKAKDEDLTVHELRKVARNRSRAKVIEGQAELLGMYRVFYADPPWQYSSSGGANSGAFRTAEEHYPTMSVDELTRLPVEAHAEKNAVLFLWVTSPMLPEAFKVIPAWGFTYKSSIVWDKVLGNFGNYVRVHHELLLIATRGSCLPDEPVPMPDSVQVIRRGDEHSEKPEEFRRLITKLYTRGPYVELFARRKVEGWTTLGNDARLWAGQHGQAKGA